MINNLFNMRAVLFVQSSQPETAAICPISVLVTKTPEHSRSTVDYKAELNGALENFAESLGVDLPLSTMINSVESARFATYKIKFSNATAAQEFAKQSRIAHVFADEITLDGSEVTMRAAGDQGGALEAIMKAHSAMAKQVSSR